MFPQDYSHDIYAGFFNITDYGKSVYYFFFERYVFVIWKIAKLTLIMTPLYYGSMADLVVPQWLACWQSTALCCSNQEQHKCTSTPTAGTSGPISYILSLQPVLDSDTPVNLTKILMTLKQPKITWRHWSNFSTDSRNMKVTTFILPDKVMQVFTFQCWQIRSLILTRETVNWKSNCVECFWEIHALINFNA